MPGLFLFFKSESRVNFLNRITETYDFDELLSKVLIADRETLLPIRAGFFHDFRALIQDAGFSFDEQKDIFSILSRLHEWRENCCETRRLAVCRQEQSASIFRCLFDVEPPPDSFAEALGNLSTNEARLILLFTVDLWCFCLFTNPVPRCPSSQVPFNSRHFLDCPRLGSPPITFQELSASSWSQSSVVDFLGFFLRLFLWIQAWQVVFPRLRQEHLKVITLAIERLQE